MKRHWRATRPNWKAAGEQWRQARQRAISKIVHVYLRSVSFRSQAEVRGTQVEFEFASGVAIEIVTGDHRSGSAAARCWRWEKDELAFFGWAMKQKSKVTPSSFAHLSRASNVGGKLSQSPRPHARGGAGGPLKISREQCGQVSGVELSFRTMDPTLPQRGGRCRRRGRSQSGHHSG